MKTLTNLSGTISETNFIEPHIHHHVLGQSNKIQGEDGARVCYPRVIRCGPAGFVFTDGKTSLVIPIEALWAVAEKYEPALKTPAGPPALPPASTPTQALKTV
jgi:hypothetical protein